MTDAISHDQNFKNLILDYPREALAFFVPKEAADIDDSARITPIRQEQLKGRLGDRFRELDVPLKIEWPDGRRAALLFVLEEETDPARFSIHRLGRYCLDLAELMKTDRVVPVVIFLHGSPDIPRGLDLGSEHETFMVFHYVSCVLSDLPAEQFKDSSNIVARITLPTMGYARQAVIDIVAWALRGLEMEPDVEKRLKYMNFIDVYSKLNDNERELFAQRYPKEDKGMLTLRQQGMQQGLQQGRQEGLQEGRSEGQAQMLLRLLDRRFGPLSASVNERVGAASAVELERWADAILDARTLDEVFGTH